VTSPYPPDAGLTYEQALAIVAGTAAAQTTAAAATSITGAMSSSVAAARDAALRYAMAVIGNLWRRVDVYDGTEVQDFTVLAGRHMVEAQTMVAATAASAQSQILAAMDVVAPLRTADPEDVRGIPEIDEAGDITVVRETQSVDYAVGGHQVIDLDEDATTVGMFNRPARTQRYLESQGMGSEEARARAEQRMLTLVDGNLMLAQRLAEAEIIAKAAATDERVIGLRRVIHPEMSRTGTCGLCIAASDRIYKVRELMPLHARCWCTTAAVTDEFDPADVLNAVDLKQLYDNAGDSTNSAALKRTRYKINEHGELGPSLIPGKRTKTSRRRSGAPAVASQDSAADIAVQRLPEREMSLAGGVSGPRAPDPAAGGGGGGGDDGGNGGGGGPRSGDDWDDDRLTPEFRKHVLDGDSSGGGHRGDSTAPAKTLFPQDWDDVDCLAAISATLDNPYTTSDDHDHLRDPNILNLYAMVNGVRMIVRTDRAGKPQTGHPLDGDGVFRNGKRAGDRRKALPLGSVRNVPLPGGSDNAR
jgi:hypothetical protein